MDNPELAHLNQIELDGPLDQPERGVLARDLATGSILVVPREIVRALLRYKHARRPEQQDEEAKKRDRMGIANLLHSVQFLRQANRAGQQPFNPLFVRLSLFSVARFQPHLTGLAQALVGPAYLWLMAGLLLVSVWLGFQSDWAIAHAFQGIFSPEALLTFAIAAPLLKVFHELGHVLAATRYRTRVAQAGILFIALFPIPFVDCSDADVSANRKQRVIISLAGLFTDILLGIIIFIAWHFTTGDFLRALLGNLFVYLTLNSVLFNVNPLVKLDGYFALTDLVRYRNLSQDGGRFFKSFQLWLGSLGRQGEVPGSSGEIAILVYAALSFFYRIYIVGFIAYSLIPRYMGLGAVLVVWGLVVMFFAPLARAPKAGGGVGMREHAPIWSVRLVVLACVALALIFVRVPVRQEIEVVIDTAGHYAMTAPETGQVTELRGYGAVSEGVVLAELEYRPLRDQLAERIAERDIALRSLEAERDGEPLRAATARQRVNVLRSQINQQQFRLQGEILTAVTGGIFVPRPDLHVGAHLEAGVAIGAFYPEQGQAILSGHFPERYVHHYRSGLRAAELRFAGQYHVLDTASLILQERITVDQQSGQRLYILQVRVAMPPAEVINGFGRVRLEFRTESLWQRMAFHARALLQNLQDARLSELERQLGTIR